ncbi:MAG: hypothetical protein EBE86_004545 [Hormoscilla sp. GUM202]|nr:hypothetical protein [Hormoscilla sp. GM7CHS1pb]MBO1346696.1 hypothetical protein [Hormoscilla sp. GUM202]
MSYFLRIFCQSSQQRPWEEIANFIEEGCYFEKKPCFEPSPSGDSAKHTQRKSLAIHYQPGKRPVIIELNGDDKLLQQEIKETISQLSERSQQESDLACQLAASKQVIAIEIDQEDAGWEMLDCLEAYLASSLSGIIYAPEDGFYDDQLQPVYQF